MKILLGTGIFMWDSAERRTQRYGYFYPGSDTYDDSVKITPRFNLKAVTNLLELKVKITVKVIESRKSGHAGDLYLDILPTQPNVGAEIVLGVGLLALKKNEYEEGRWDIGLKPEDERKQYWIDPHKYYQLHDQTVEIYVEKTDEPCHEAPNIVPVREACKAISNGDGSIQFVSPVDVPDGTKLKIKPNVERLGKGLFKLTLSSAQGNKGETFDMEILNG